MRSKTPLALMEQLVMVLVFALAAAVCLQIFAFSNQRSRRNEAVSEAALLAQNTAEKLKQVRGNLERILPGEPEQLFLEEQVEEEKSCLNVYYDENWQMVSGREDWRYRLEVEKEETAIEGLGRADIRVLDGKDGEDEILFQISAAWQEIGDE